MGYVSRSFSSSVVFIYGQVQTDIDLSFLSFILPHVLPILLRQFTMSSSINDLLLCLFLLFIEDDRRRDLGRSGELQRRHGPFQRSRGRER